MWNLNQSIDISMVYLSKYLLLLIILLSVSMSRISNRVSGATGIEHALQIHPMYTYVTASDRIQAQY